MKKESAKKGRKFFKAYFILAIIFALVGLLDSFISLGYSHVPILWQIFTGLFALAILVLSVIALVIFTKNKFKKITLVIPIYYLAVTILSFLVGVVFGFVLVSQGRPIGELSIPSIFIPLGIIASLFELIFSTYIFLKFK